jgi:hypothetical protein
VNFRTLLVSLLVFFLAFSPAHAAHLLKIGQIVPLAKTHTESFPTNFTDPEGLETGGYTSTGGLMPAGSHNVPIGRQELGFYSTVLSSIPHPVAQAASFAIDAATYDPASGNLPPTPPMFPGGFPGVAPHSQQTGSQAHHVIQDAAVRNLPGYSYGRAPTVPLAGQAAVRGTPHNLATRVQQQRGGGNLAAECRIGYKALRRGGYSAPDARSAVGQAMQYFQGLGYGPNTPTRIPGNRR